MVLWNFPPSLIHFEAISVRLETPSSVSKLPPSLESLSASQLFYYDLLLPLLPSSTRYLRTGSQAKCSDRHRSLRNLPGLADFNFETTPELISLLPSTLTELDIVPVLPCSFWPLLPPQVTKLSLNAPHHLRTVDSIIIVNGIQHEVKSIPFDALPRSITKLCLRTSKIGQHFCGPPATSNRSYFPPQLRYLEIRDTQLSPEIAKLLPSSLTYLEIGNFCEQVCEHLPASLKTLISYCTLVTPNLIKFLPKSLTYLHLYTLSHLITWFDCNTGQRIDSVSELPEYSIYEKCLSTSFDWKDFSPLPSTLTYFNLTSALQLGDSFLLHRNLPNLLELNLSSSRHLTDLSIPLLPSHLTTLALGSTSQISGKSFQFLPRCLVTLFLNSAESILDSDIQHLPQTLKYGSFDKTIHLTELCIPHLPPHLERLRPQVSCGPFLLSQLALFPTILSNSFHRRVFELVRLFRTTGHPK